MAGLSFPWHPVCCYQRPWDHSDKGRLGHRGGFRRLSLNGVELEAGDGAAVENETRLELQALEPYELQVLDERSRSLAKTQRKTVPSS